MVAFPKFPDFNFNGSNPFVEEVQNARGKIAASGYLDMSIQDVASTVGARIGIDLNNLDLSGPLKELQQAAGLKNISFPEKIETIGNYMNIDIFKERIFEAALGVQRRRNREKLLTIKLPLPSSLQTAYAQGYKQEGLGPIGAAAATEVSGLAKDLAAGNKPTGSELTDALTKVSKRVGVEGLASLGLGAADDIAGLAGAKIGGIAGAIVGDSLGKVVQGAAASAGIARNPHMAVLYEAPNFRNFQFSFDLKPKNQRESLIINEIIHKLKFHSHPSKTEKEHFFNYPEQMGIRFQKDGYLFRTRSLVLTNINVEYHGEGTPLYYDAGGTGNSQKAPAAVRLDLTFTETKILTKSDIQDGM